MHGGAYGNVTRENIVEGNNVYNTRNNAHNTIDINKAWNSAWGAQKNIFTYPALAVHSAAPFLIPPDRYTTFQNTQTPYQSNKYAGISLIMS